MAANVNRDKLKKIRWFSNGAWQFQPHLHFMEEMYSDKEEFANRVELMELGGVIMKDENYFKMDLEEGK